MERFDNLTDEELVKLQKHNYSASLGDVLTEGVKGAVTGTFMGIGDAITNTALIGTDVANALELDRVGYALTGQEYEEGNQLEYRSLSRTMEDEYHANLGTMHHVASEVTGLMAGGASVRGLVTNTQGSGFLASKLSKSVAPKVNQWLAGGGAMRQAGLVVGSETVASALINDPYRESLIDTITGDESEEGSFERRIRNFSEDAVLGVVGEGVVAGVKWGGKSLFRALGNAPDVAPEVKVIEGSKIVDDMNPNVTQKVAEEFVPSVSLVGDVAVDSKLATGGINYWNLTPQQQLKYYKNQVNQGTKADIKDIEIKIGELENSRVLKDNPSLEGRLNKEVDAEISLMRKQMEELKEKSLDDIDEYMRHPVTLRRLMAEELQSAKAVIQDKTDTLKHMTLHNPSGRVASIRKAQKDLNIAKADLKVLTDQDGALRSLYETTEALRYSKYFEPNIAKVTPEKKARIRNVNKVREARVVKEIPESVTAPMGMTPKEASREIKRSDAVYKEIEDAFQLITARYNAGDLTEEQMLVAKRFLDAGNGITKKGGTDLRLNPATNGDNNIQALESLGRQLSESVDFKKKVRGNAEVILNTFNAMTTKSSKAKRLLKEYSFEFGNARSETIIRNISVLESMGYDAEVVLMKARILRTNKVREVRDIMDDLDSLVNLEDADYVKFSLALNELDKLDSSISGTLSTAGRMLQLMQVDPSQFGARLLKLQNQTVEDSGVEKKIYHKIAESTGGKLSSDDKKQIKKLIKKLKKSDMKPQDIEEATKFHAIAEYMKAGLVGGLLGDPRTWVRSVGLATVLNYLNKQVLDVISQNLLRGQGFGKIADIPRELWTRNITPVVFLRQLLDENMSRLSRKVDADYQNSVGSISKWKDILSAIDDTIEGYGKEGATFRAKGTQLMKYPLGVYTSMSNFGISAIKKVDTVMSEASALAQIRGMAHRRWLIDQGEHVFGGKVDYTDFVDQYTDLGMKTKNLDEAVDTGRISFEEYEKKLDETFVGVHPDLRDDILEEVKKDVLTAQRVALETTLQEEAQDFWLGKLLAYPHRMSKGNPLGEFAISLEIPFTKSPANAVRSMLEYSPLGYMSGRLRQMIKNGGEEAVEAKARILTGTLGYATVAGMVSALDIIGKEIPPQYRDEPNVKPYSVRYGDTWVSYDRLGLVTSMIGMVSDILNLGASGEELVDVENDVTAWSYICAGISNTLGTSPLVDLTEVLDLMSDPTPNSAGKHILDKAQMAITPLAGMQRFASDLVEGEERVLEYTYDEQSAFNEVDSVIADFYARAMTRWSRAPINRFVGESVIDSFGVAGDYTQRTDILGRSIARHEDTLLGRALFMSGFNNSPANTDPVLSEMARLNKIPSPRTLYGSTPIDEVDLTVRDRNKLLYNKYQGEHGAITYMRSMMLSGVYDQKVDGTRATAEEKGKAWDAVISQGETYAKALVESENPEITKKRQKQKYEELMKSLTTY